MPLAPWIFLVLIVAGIRPLWAGELPLVAAAADLKFALTEVAERFTAETGRAVTLTFGSSGTFATQLEQGAPFELFLSADEQYVFALADKGLTRDRGTLYAVGRIVLFAPRGSPFDVEAGWDDLEAALAMGRLRRFAIANPAHAPYGRAARAALEHRGLWHAIEPLLVLGENAAQAAEFAASGASDGGIVPLSLALASAVGELGKFALIPETWHAGVPLRQRMVLTVRAGPTATAFYAYLQQASARAILARYGFAPPKETAP